MVESGDPGLVLEDAKPAVCGQGLLFGEDADEEGAMPRNPLVPLALLREKVNPTERLLLIALLSYCQPEKDRMTCWPGEAKLASDLDFSQRTIRESLADLEKKGLITRSRVGFVRKITLHISYNWAWTSDDQPADSREATGENASRYRRERVAIPADSRASSGDIPPTEGSKEGAEEVSQRRHEEKARADAALAEEDDEDPFLTDEQREEMRARKRAERTNPLLEGDRPTGREDPPVAAPPPLAPASAAKRARRAPEVQAADDGSMPWSWMLARWNEMAGRVPGPSAMQAWTEQRKTHARARIGTADPRATWERVCSLVEESPFLSRTCLESQDRSWRPGIDWVLTAGAWAKILELKYAPKKAPVKPAASGADWTQPGFNPFAPPAPVPYVCSIQPPPEYLAALRASNDAAGKGT